MSHYPHKKALKNFWGLVERDKVPPVHQYLYCQDCGKLLYAHPILDLPADYATLRRGTDPSPSPAARAGEEKP